MTDEELLDAARDVREKAYCPYSGFHVGAAIVDENDQVHVGCNVENAAYPQGSCAEAGAIAAMIAAGGTRIVTIAVAGGGENKTRACTPCGGCRQRIHEFADENTRIIVKDDDEDWHTFTMDDLLPSSFHL
ncbi:MAG: cytidine deaminase [Gammaproteobacteria bacterium]|jgi:cytidine deaminase|nr:cytidine deaminase [Gammaproteobacteria bacterium]MDH3749866.1 cytidine deaminase [Gammaproteobacteria bacterium]